MKTTTNRSWSSPYASEPVIVSRVPVYAPISRKATNGAVAVKHEEYYSWETKWGTISMNNLMTWEHRRILLLVNLRAKEKRLWDDGSLSVQIDAYAIKKELGYRQDGRDHNRFLQRLRDMKDVNLVVKNKKTGTKTESSILWSHKYNYKDGGPISDTGSEEEKKEKMRIAKEKGNGLFEIRFSKEYMELFKDDLRIHCDQLVPDLIQIKDGLIASIILFFLTMQGECRYKILDVLKIIGVEIDKLSKGRVSQILKKIRTNTDFERFGIAISRDCLIYERNKCVFFTKPAAPKGQILTNPALEPKTHESLARTHGK